MTSVVAQRLSKSNKSETTGWTTCSKEEPRLLRRPHHLDRNYNRATSTIINDAYSRYSSLNPEEMAMRTSSLVGIRRREDALCARVARKTGFARDFVANLMCYAESLAPPNLDGLLDRAIFTAEMIKTFRMSSLYIIDRLYIGRKIALMTVEQYVLGISVFLTSYSDKKMDLAFDVYDRNADGSISRTEIWTLSKFFMPGEDTESTEEMIHDFLDYLMKAGKAAPHHAKDEEGISRVEYKATLLENAALKELMHDFLPGEDCVREFKKTIDPKKYTPSVVRIRMRNRRQKMLQDPPLNYGVLSRMVPITLAQPSTEEILALKR